MTVQVSKKDALEGPESVQFLEADSLEKAQVESHKTWRPLLDGELQPSDEIIPCSVIYTKKRDGRYKARIVVLGNRQKAGTKSEIFSPTVSHPGNRFLLVD